MKSLLTTLALVLLLAAPATAQEVPAITEAEQWTLNQVQLIESLDSPITLVRTQSLKNAIIFATLYRDKVNLRDAVEAIQTVYETDDDATNRKLALAALQAIGTRRAQLHIADASPRDHEAGRALMVSVLNDYYTTRPTATSSLGSSF